MGVPMTEYRNRHDYLDSEPRIDWPAFYVLCGLTVLATSATMVVLLTRL
jgi:hypothetical protein